MQALTEVFPISIKERTIKRPLQLVKCHGNEGENVCGLVLLGYICLLGLKYWDKYSYRLGLST